MGRNPAFRVILRRYARCQSSARALSRPAIALRCAANGGWSKRRQRSPIDAARPLQPRPIIGAGRAAGSSPLSIALSPRRRQPPTFARVTPAALDWPSARADVCRFAAFRRVARSAQRAAIDILPVPARARPRAHPRAARRDSCWPTRSASARRYRPASMLAELRRRGWCERALILTPAGLRQQWADELLQRFEIEAAVIDATVARRPRRVAAVRRESMDGRTGRHHVDRLRQATRSVCTRSSRVVGSSDRRRSASSHSRITASRRGQRCARRAPACACCSPPHRTPETIARIERCARIGDRRGRSHSALPPDARAGRHASNAPRAPAAGPARRRQDDRNARSARSVSATALADWPQTRQAATCSCGDGPGQARVLERAFARHVARAASRRRLTRRAEAPAQTGAAASTLDDRRVRRARAAACAAFERVDEERDDPASTHQRRRAERSAATGRCARSSASLRRVREPAHRLHRVPRHARRDCAPRLAPVGHRRRLHGGQTPQERRQSPCASFTSGAADSPARDRCRL